MKMGMRNDDDSDVDDPEDLTMAHGNSHNKFNPGFSPNRKFHFAKKFSQDNKFMYYLNHLTAFSHPNTTITRVRQDAQKFLENQKDQATGSAILDTYLQFITENTFGESEQKCKRQVYVLNFSEN